MAEASCETDFVTWSERQAWLLREGRPGEIDVAHLAEEVEGVGNACRDEAECRPTVLIARQSEWKHQPGDRCRNREATLTEQRRRIAGVTRRAPSLRTCPPNVFADSYPSARLAASKETGMDVTIFPAPPPFTLAEALDIDFQPIEPDREIRG